MISFLETELDAVRRDFAVPDGELVVCVPAQVRVNYRLTTHKDLTVCLQFPDKYPDEPAIVELKSKMFSYKLLTGLTTLADNLCRDLVGKEQVMPLIKFLRQWLDDTPLCVCSEEISSARKFLTESDDLKLKQKLSQIHLRLQRQAYFIFCKISVPHLYPVAQIRTEISEHNFPPSLLQYIAAQCTEIARKCVQPPLCPKKKAPPFEPGPSLFPVVEFLVKNVMNHFPGEKCRLCGNPALPLDPKDIENGLTRPLFVERVYCNHLYHYGCLHKFMNTPPFLEGKKCLACGVDIYHEKWRLSADVLEKRWAHRQARDREVAEVADFFS